MDFTEQLAEEEKNRATANSEGAALLQDAKNEDILNEEKRQNGKYQSAYDGSDLNNSGPSMEEYDYESAFKDGNSFKPDDNGGIDLYNKNVKPATYEIAGHDLVTGDRYTNQYADADGLISEGIADLQNSRVNTKTGTPPNDMVPLTKIAHGVAKEGATYEDFVLASKGPWSDQQRATAWDSMRQAKLTIDDVNNQGQRFWLEHSKISEGAEDTTVKYPRIEGLQQDIDETELVSSPVWIASGKKVIDYFNPEGSAAMSEEEVHKFNLSMMSQFNYNLPMMMFMTNEIVKSKDPELAKSFLFLMDQTYATNTSWASVKRAVGGLGGDITTYATLGGSVLVSRISGAAMKVGVKQALTKIASVTAVDVAAGATLGAVSDVSEQTIEAAADEREELDVEQTATVAGVTAGVALTAGLGSAVVSDPALRQFGKKTAQKAISNMTSGTPKPYGSRAAMKGQIGVERTPKQVEFRSRLKEEIDKSFKGQSMSVKKMKNKIKNWVAEGKVKQEEVDWAGINFLDGDGAVTRDEIRAFIDFRRPTPSLDPVKENQFPDLSFGNPEGGYRERVINIDKTGHWKGPEGHFGATSTTGENQVNVGHLRLTTTKAGGKKGTMFLEGQSDIRKTPRHATRAMSREGEAVQVSQDAKMMQQANVNLATAQSNYESFSLDMARKYNIDPKDQFFDAKMMDNMNISEDKKWSELLSKEMQADLEAEKSAAKLAKSGDVPFTPFRNEKASNDLMFRSAIMDAMNDGSEFLSWPQNYEQMAIIEGWGDLKDPRLQSASKFMLKDMKKLAKSYGFTVEEYVPDEFANKTRTVNKNIIVGSEEYLTALDDWLDSMEYAIEVDGDILKIFDNDGSIVMEFTDALEYNRWVVSKIAVPEEVPFENNKFLRIKFTPEQKLKWQKEGASMYSFGAPVGVGAAMAEQKRDEKGRFK